MKHHIIPLSLLALTLSLAACISDDSSEMTADIPTLSIAGADAKEMPAYNFNLGETCEIRPEITYSGASASDLSYTWSVGTLKNDVKGELKEVSHDATLSYSFAEGGTYYAHLTVTDGRVGSVCDYRVNVNRTFEEGYIIVSNDNDGTPDLAFVKTMTPEELASGVGQITMRHCLARMNPGMESEPLVGVLVGSYTNLVTYASVPRLCLSTPTRCLLLDPNTLAVLGSLNYEDEVPGFRATDFINAGYKPCAYDKTTGKFVHVDVQYMIPFTDQNYAGLTFDNLTVGAYESWGSMNYQPLFTSRATSEVFTVDAYSGLCTSGDRMADEDIITAFTGSYDEDNYWLVNYALGRVKGSATECRLHTWGDIWDWTDFSTKEFTATAATAMPAEGSKIVYSATYQRHYYAIGSKVYVCLTTAAEPLPTKEEYALALPDGEEITFMDLSGDDLILGTYNATAAVPGSLWVYDAKDVRTDNRLAVQPKAAYLGVAGRIRGVMYKTSM